MPLLHVEKLSKLYRKSNHTVKALDAVSFNVAKGEFVTILGRSGSGKSTLLNLVGGLDTPDQGTILFDGNQLHQMSRKELELHRRHSVGMIFQSFNLVPYRSALDNVELALVFGGMTKKLRRHTAIKLLDQVGLAERSEHLPSELSGGENQRVAIARALANNPKMLLADEPTGNLDSTTSSEIMALLLELNREHGLTIVMITHEEAIARSCSDRIITLLDGRIISIEDNNTDKRRANEIL